MYKNIKDDKNSVRRQMISHIFSSRKIREFRMIEKDAKIIPKDVRLNRKIVLLTKKKIDQLVQWKLLVIYLKFILENILKLKRTFLRNFYSK